MKKRSFKTPISWLMALAGLSWVISAQASEVIQIDAKVYRLLADGSQEIIATPQLITQPGEWATFQDVESITYATEFDRPSIPVEFSSSANPKPKGNTEPAWETNDRHTVIPAHPTKFETKDHGLTFKVRPRLGNDGKIFVDGKVEQVSFDGYANATTPVSFELPKPIGKKTTTFTVENSHTRLATFRTRQQEWFFSPDGEKYAVKTTSDVSHQSAGSTIADELPEILVSIETKKIPLAKKEIRVPDDYRIYVTSRFIESREPLELDNLKLSDSEYEQWVREINQVKNLDLLSAPSIVMKGGQPGKIEILREFIYPTEYDPPQLPSDQKSETSFPVTPSNPTEFDTANVGVSAAINARALDNGQIELELGPEVVEFERFDNLGAPVVLLQKNSVGKYEPIVLTDNAIELPRFHERSINYKVRIANGDKVIVQGLIRKDSQAIETKVPLLGDLPVVGRLGRTSTVETFDRHLYIVFSAELMDSDGNVIGE